MPVDMPNAMRTFLITTSAGDAITMSAIDEWEVKKLFIRTFPRKRICTIHEYPRNLFED